MEDASEDIATRGPFLLHALELGPGHCLISLDFWLLFFVCAIGALLTPPLTLTPSQTSLHPLYSSMYHEPRRLFQTAEKGLKR